MKTVELPEKVWIVERTPFCGDDVSEYEVSSCTYLKGKLQTIVVNNEYTKNWHIDIEEYSRCARGSYLCFSYEEAVEKLKRIGGKK